MLSRRRAASCAECRRCRLRAEHEPDARAGFYCEARAVLVDRADLWLRCCDKFETWRSPPER